MYNASHTLQTYGQILLRFAASELIRFRTHSFIPAETVTTVYRAPPTASPEVSFPRDRNI